MPRRTFYGWYLVSGLGLTTIVSYGVSQYLFGVLVVPIQRDLGWSRATISGAFSVGLVFSGLLGLLIGRLVDRHGARALMSAGSVLGAASLLGLSGVTQVWQFYLLWSGCIGLAMALTLYPVTFVVVANWFTRRRGAALALLTVLGGLSSPIYIPASGLLVERLGWRPALQVLALTALLIALPIHALLVRRRPEDMGLLPDGGTMPAGHDPAQVGGHALRAALRLKPFWTLMAATALSTLAYSVLLAHVVAYLIGLGYRPVLAATLLGLTGLASLPARFIFNFISDRFGPQPLLTMCLALQGLSVLLLMAGSLPFVIAFVIVYGTAFGAVSPLRASVMADHFGRLAYGSINAVHGVPAGVFAGLGPFLAGLLFDLRGDYRLAFALTCGTFLVAALAVMLTPRAGTQSVAAAC
ncbi:MAG: MFS transporter [Candidatus Dormibacteraeota bacterium]|nr:MFS transporter [Candidatus Dormibacteraeota bacterium]